LAVAIITAAARQSEPIETRASAAIISANARSIVPQSITKATWRRIGHRLPQRSAGSKRASSRERSSWNPLWDQLLAWDPEFFEAYFNFSAVPWRREVLPPKVKELIYIAIDASATHLYARACAATSATRSELGASREEILEVLELISVLGIHACNLGVPILAEELKQRDSAPRRTAVPAKRKARKRG
jgi:alkylhydroperoxidase/carboxymuconolactone decarboxylase family protein YurZ